MAEELKKDEKSKVKIKLNIKTIHKTLLADAKFLEKFKSEDRKQAVLTMKATKDSADKLVEAPIVKEPKK